VGSGSLSLLIDAWEDHPSTAYASPPVELKAAQKYLLKLEYYEKKLHAGVKLAWSCPSMPVQIIPQSQLYSQVPDTDQDGLPDDWEISYGLDPRVPTDAALDADQDGLTNLEEFQAGTNPLQADSDGDRMPDRWELDHGLRAYDPKDALADLDRDGLNNLAEYQLKTDPGNPDSDGDGFSDGREVHQTKTNPLDKQPHGAQQVGFPVNPEHLDIGAVGLPGNAGFESQGGIYTVAGSGTDIWNYADAFHFAFEPLYGDGQIVARILNIEPTDDWAKAGLMIRDNPSAGARHAFIALTPGFGAAFQRRVNPDGRSVGDTHPQATVPARRIWFAVIIRPMAQIGNWSAGTRSSCPAKSGWDWRSAAITRQHCAPLDLVKSH
jgi:hypothetical protein